MVTFNLFFLRKEILISWRILFLKTSKAKSISHIREICFILSSYISFYMHLMMRFPYIIPYLFALVFTYFSLTYTFLSHYLGLINGDKLQIWVLFISRSMVFLILCTVTFNFEIICYQIIYTHIYLYLSSWL